MAVIQPTIGRVVLYHAPGTIDEAWPALIAKVNSDTSINVGGFKSNGQPFADCDVLLLQDSESYGNPGGGSWAEWIPYQKGQAQKTEELEKKLAEQSKDQASETTKVAPGVTTAALGNMTQQAAKPRG